ncbi:hypothetical protein ACFX10_008366 [Malus domestica]
MSFNNWRILFATVFFVPILICDASSFQAFEEWTAVHGRVYSSAEERELRLAIFKNNFEFVEKFNKNGKGFTVGLNHFADLTTEEITNGYCCRLVQSDSTTNMTISDNVVAVGNIDNSTCSCWSKSTLSGLLHVIGIIDWVEYGGVTPVRDQTEECACCWAFAAVTGIEGIYGIKRGKDKVVPVSPQQLVDCDEFSDGCKGGLEANAYDYVSKRGIVSEASYPYKAKKGECNREILESLPVVTRINRYHHVLPRDEETLTRAVCRQPVTVGIDSRSAAFYYYKGGIFRDECGTDLIHSVTIVGIGRDESGTEYWKIKNSWGKEWGEGGYMKLLKDGSPNGHCGITMDATYPVID